MEKMMMINALFFVALLVVVDGATPLPPAPHDCYSLGFALIPCLEYCVMNSNATKPTRDCCSHVAITLKYNATCFCGVLSHAWEFGYDLNQTRGMMIPPLCGFPHDKLPPAARCNETSPPLPSPAPAPAPVPPPPRTPPPAPPPPSSPPPPSTPPSTPPPSTPPPSSSPPPPSPSPPSKPSPPPTTKPSPPTPPSTSPTEASNVSATPASSPKSSGTSIVPPLVLVFIFIQICMLLHF